MINKVYSGRKTPHGKTVVTVNGKPLPLYRRSGFYSDSFTWGRSAEETCGMQLAWALINEHFQRRSLKMRMEKCATYHYTLIPEVVRKLRREWKLTDSDLEQAFARIDDRA